MSSGKSAEQSIIVLQNDRLKVDIAKPGTAYEGPRFDWTGFITQVVLDGKHTFCSKQDFTDSNLIGIGLCNEFGIGKPIGYDEIGVGEQFPKIGVGLLTKFSEEPYFAGDLYAIQPYSIRTEVGTSGVRFIVEPHECNGYAMKLEKTIALKDQSVIVSYRLYNTGSKPIDTHEYAHNFISINRHETGPDYRLTLPDTVMTADLPDVMRMEGNRVFWHATPDKPFSCQFQGCAGPFQWELEHIPSGLGVRESVDTASAKVAVWGKSHIICAEAFVDIRLAPGCDKQWSRCYEFFSDVR